MKIKDIRQQITATAMRAQNPAVTQAHLLQKLLAELKAPSGDPIEANSAEGFCKRCKDVGGLCITNFYGDPCCLVGDTCRPWFPVTSPPLPPIPSSGKPATCPEGYVFDAVLKKCKPGKTPTPTPRPTGKAPTLSVAPKVAAAKPQTVRPAPLLIPQFNPGAPEENHGGHGGGHHGRRHGGGGIYALYPSYAYPFSYYPYAPYAYTTFGYPYVYPYAPWNYYWSWYYPYWGGGATGRIFGGTGGGGGGQPLLGGGGGGGQPLLGGGGGFGGAGMGGLAAVKNPSDYRIVGEPYIKQGKRHIKVQDTHTGEVHEIPATA